MDLNTLDLNGVVTQVLGIDYFKNQWLKAIEAFKVNERKFQLAYADLSKNRQKYYAAGLRPQYDAVYNRGRAIQNSVGSVINASKRIYDYFKTSTNLGAPFIAAIPIGSIIGITALIGAFLTSYYVLNRAYTEYNIRQLPLDQQAAVRGKMVDDANAPIGAGISNSVYAIGALMLVVLFLPKLMDKR